MNPPFLALILLWCRLCSPGVEPLFGSSRDSGKVSKTIACWALFRGVGPSFDVLLGPGITPWETHVHADIWDPKNLRGSLSTVAASQYLPTLWSHVLNIAVVSHK